jgi:hypothetical protein
MRDVKSQILDLEPRFARKMTCIEELIDAPLDESWTARLDEETGRLVVCVGERAIGSQCTAEPEALAKAFRRCVRALMLDAVIEAACRHKVLVTGANGEPKLVRIARDEITKGWVEREKNARHQAPEEPLK